MPDLARTYGESLARLVQVPTVTGSDRQNFVNFRKVLAEEFPAVYRACDVIRPGGEDSDALIFKWKGKSSRRPLVLMAHQDVVPAEGDWKYPPYSGTIADGKVWGRGAMDCKNTLFATMRSVNELIEEGFVPEQDVYLCYSDSEETSGPGARYCRDWLKSAGVTPAVAIDEGGAIVEQAFPGMTKPFAMVGFIEKGYCDVKFVARSKGGHSSSPPKHTPFARLAAFMHYCETHTVFKRRLSEPAREMLVGLSDGLSGALKFVTKHAGFFAPLITAVLPRLTPFGAALTGTTMTFTMAQGSGAPNVIPQEAYVVANLRSTSRPWSWNAASIPPRWTPRARIFATSRTPCARCSRTSASRLTCCSVVPTAAPCRPSPPAPYAAPPASSPPSSWRRCTRRTRMWICPRSSGRCSSSRHISGDINKIPPRSAADKERI